MDMAQKTLISVLQQPDGRGVVAFLLVHVPWRRMRTRRRPRWQVGTDFNWLDQELRGRSQFGCEAGSLGRHEDKVVLCCA
jgi:hypothetical protein